MRLIVSAASEIAPGVATPGLTGGTRLRFGEFVLDPARRELRHADSQVALEPKVFDCIELLVRDAGKLTSMERLRSSLWPGVCVGEGALRRVINEARKALGDTGSTQHIIRTRKGLGYQFLPQVVEDSRFTSCEAARDWPFVGRERELGVLRDWLAKGHAGGLCFVSGEAGSGKSSLLARLASQSSSQGHWLFGHCQATPGLPALWPFRQLAQRLLHDPALRSSALALAAQSPGLLQLVPEFAGKEPVASCPAVVSAETRFELCQTFAALLGALSSERALWLSIEDVHWADDGSLVLLEAVARAARNQPLHVFASYRPEAVAAGSALAHLVGRTSGRDGVFSLHLEPLDVEALRALLRELQLPGLPAHAAPALLQRTGGNSLYVFELVRHMLASSAPLAAALPPSLEHIIAERTSTLPSTTQHRLDQAAVLGEDFGLAPLAAAADISRVALDFELEPAHQRGLLRRSPLHPERLRFTHALVRDALLLRLSPHQKQAYHRIALHALETLPAGSTSSGELAVHAFEAGDELPPEERRRLYAQAGREAFAGQSFDRAALHLGRALHLMAADDCSPDTAELSLLRAIACWHADEPEREVEAAFRQAAERARRAGSPALLAEAAIGYAVGDGSSVMWRTASWRPGALDLAEEAWQRLVSDAAGDVRGWPDHVAYRLAAALCWLRIEAGELADLQRAAQRAVALAPTDLGQMEQVWLLGLRSAAEPERAVELFDEMLKRVREPGLDPRRCFEIVALVMVGYLAHGKLTGWERAASELGRVSALLPQPTFGGGAGERTSMYISLPLCVPVTRAVIAGQLAAAERQFLNLVDHVRRLQLPRSRERDHGAFHILLQLYGYLGRSRELQSLLEHEWGQSPRGRWFAALAHTQFALERGDRARAEAHFALLRSSGLRPTLGEWPLLAKPETLLRLADACVEIGTPADAARLYAALLPRAGLFIQDGALICWGSCSRPLGGLAFQLQRYEDAERHYRDALAMNRRIGHRPELVRTQLGLARVLSATDRASAASALLVAAKRDASEMGMAPMVELANRLGG